VVRRLLLTAAMLAGSATAAVAHHSIAGVYDSKSSVTVDGVVSEQFGRLARLVAAGAPQAR